MRRCTRSRNRSEIAHTFRGPRPSRLRSRRSSAPRRPSVERAWPLVPAAPVDIPNGTARMRAIAEQECDAAEARGETGYPAMWVADRLEVIEDCLQWLEVERAAPQTTALSLGACEARFGRRHPGEQTSTLSRDEPVAIELAG